MKNVKSVELHFENTEDALISAEHIETLSLSGIEKTIRFSGGTVSEMLTAREIFIRLSAGANIPMEKMGSEEEVLLFERILGYNDIVIVKINYTDGTEASFYTKWRDNGGYERNLYQKSEENLFDDSLIVTIAPPDSDMFFNK